MLAEYQKKTNYGIAFDSCSNLVPLFLAIIQSVYWFLSLAATFIWGCCCYAIGKGFRCSGGLGFLSLLGLIVLILLPTNTNDRNFTGTEHPVGMPPAEFDPVNLSSRLLEDNAILFSKISAALNCDESEVPTAWRSHPFHVPGELERRWHADSFSCRRFGMA